MNNNPHNAVRTQYRTKFLHKPSSFSPWVPGMLKDLPLPGDAFCSSCTRKDYLLPPALAAFSGYSNLTQSLTHKSQPDGSSPSPLSLSSPLFASQVAPRLPILLLLSPWCRGTGMPGRVHRFYSPAVWSRTFKSQCNVAGKYFLGSLCAKGEDNGCVEQLASALGFARCLTSNLSNEPKV